MSRANVRVRPATTDDVSALASLVQTVDPGTAPSLKAELKDTVSSAASTREHLCTRFAEIVAQADRTVLVATDDSGELAGLLAARVDTVGGIDLTPVLHVTHLLVAPTQRRKGVGRALLAGAVHLADEAGVENVLTSSAAGSREGNRYLARIGFAPLVINRIAPTSVLRRSLGMTDVAGRVAVLRRARLVRGQRSAFGPRAVGRGA